MLIKLWQRPKVVSKGDMELKKKALIKGEQIQQMTDTPGWSVIEEELKKELKRASDLKSLNAKNIDERRGYCDGIRYVFECIHHYKRVAESSRKDLDDFVAQQKEI